MKNWPIIPKQPPELSAPQQTMYVLVLTFTEALTKGLLSWSHLGLWYSWSHLLVSGGFVLLALNSSKRPINCLKLKRHQINVPSNWIRRKILKYSSHSCAQGAAGQQQSWPPKCRGSSWTETWGQLCHQQLRSGTRQEALNTSSKGQEIFVYSLSFSIWTQFLRIPSATVRKSSLCDRAKENLNHDIWTALSKDNLYQQLHLG